MAYVYDSMRYSGNAVFLSNETSSGLTVNADVGTADALGYTASIDRQYSVSVTLGAATASGYDAAINLRVDVEATLGTATASGYDAYITFGNDRDIAASFGLASADGYQAAINLRRDIDATVGIATASGYDASIALGSLTLTAADLAAIDALIAARCALMPSAADIAAAVIASGVLTTNKFLALK